MRDREVIQREMFRAREDLEQNLAQLKHVVQEKIDVKARARVAVAKGKAYAHEALDRGKESAVNLYDRGKVGAQDLAVRGKDGAVRLFDNTRDTVKERPVATAAIVGGILATGVLVYVGYRNNWWR